jgi:hypothetical protein
MTIAMKPFGRKTGEKKQFWQKNLNLHLECPEASFFKRIFEPTEKFARS